MDLFGTLKKECSYPLLISSGNEMLLSLIIPVYKVEQYIAECIESVINQVTSDIEVIIVNDGTPDDSMLVIEKILSKQTAIIRDCFIILHQENQGQSSARNLGLKYAKGEYISFLDSDDLLEPEYFEKVINILIKSRPEIIRFNFKTYPVENLKLKKNNNYFKVGMNIINDDLLLNFFNDSLWYPWMNIYRKDLLKDFNFVEGIYFEDLASLPFVFLKIKSLYYINEILYKYRVHSKSSLNNTSKGNLKKNIESFQFVIELLSSKIAVNKNYGVIYVITVQSYISFLIKNGFYLFSYKENRRLKVNKHGVDENLLKNRGNLIFYKMGYLFLLIQNFLKFKGN